MWSGRSHCLWGSLIFTFISTARLQQSLKGLNTFSVHHTALSTFFSLSFFFFEAEGDMGKPPKPHPHHRPTLFFFINWFWRGLQMDNIKEWTSLPVPELLTRASCRKRLEEDLCRIVHHVPPSLLPNDPISRGIELKRLHTNHIQNVQKHQGEDHRFSGNGSVAKNCRF